jgi:hypothetical protein
MANQVDMARRAGEDGMAAVGKAVGSIIRVSETRQDAGEVRGLGDRAGRSRDSWRRSAASRTRRTFWR